MDRINALVEATPGFVGRLQSESGNATDIQAFDDPHLLVNMSVWTSVNALRAYVYQSARVVWPICWIWTGMERSPMM